MNLREAFERPISIPVAIPQGLIFNLLKLTPKIDEENIRIIL
jgi:hypothetical protein